MATVEEDLNQLEKDIRTFKIEFEQYFGGGKKRPPADTEWRIDLVMKRYSGRGLNMNASQRFRYSTMAMTYSKYRQMFRKRLQDREEGAMKRHFGAAAKVLEAQRTRADARLPAKQEVEAFAVIITDPDAETVVVRGLFDALSRAQQKAGEASRQLTLEQFREFIRQKTVQLQKQKSGRPVEYRIEMKSGKVSLKARVRS